MYVKTYKRSLRNVESFTIRCAVEVLEAGRNEIYVFQTLLSTYSVKWIALFHLIFHITLDMKKNFLFCAYEITLDGVISRLIFYREIELYV